MDYFSTRSADEKISAAEAIIRGSRRTAGYMCRRAFPKYLLMK